MRKLTSRPGLRSAVALTSALFLTAACGTRTEDPSPNAAATNPTAAGPGTLSGTPADSGTAAGAPAGSPDSAATVTPGASPPSPPEGPTGAAARSGGSASAAPGSASEGKASTGSAPRSGSGGNTSSAAQGASAGPGTATPAPDGGATAGPGTPAPDGGARNPAPGGASAVPPGDSPINIASVGILSGPAGAALAPNVTGVQIWVKWINDRGGLNGHPVKLFVYDDGGDPAKHRAQVQDAIESKKVIAFVMNNEAIAGQGSVDYIESKRVPVIGNEGASYWFYDSPMYFVQASTGDANFHAAIGAGAQLLLEKGKRYGSIVCVEADGCNAAARVTSESAEALGFEVVYGSRASIAQPDYTAECLAARNAGVQTLLVFLDPAGIGRVGTACARQGFNPNYLTANSLVVDAQKDDPNLKGIVASTPVFPWFQKGTPATDEYQEAVKRYGQGLTPGVGGPTGWTSAKVFEKAAANMTEPPTSEAVLQGLWTFRNEDLGGITQPLTFFEGKTATPVSCWFTIVVQDAEWTTPDNFQRHCQQ